MSKYLIFITGSTGYIGSQVVAATLKAGYRVRLSIRKIEQESALRKRYPGFNTDIETVVISDLSNADYIQKSLHGVDYIFHIASPMAGKGVGFRKGYVNPAVEGTLAILNAAIVFKGVKKVIVMSSMLSLVPETTILTPGAAIMENTGKELAVNPSMTVPEGFSGHAVMYSASKILAHQATRDFFKNQAPHFKVITFHPTFFMGESIIQESAEDKAVLNAGFLESLKSEKPQFGNVWVHVLDVADAHVKVLEKDVESGTEIILSHPAVSWEESANFVKENYPGIECKLQPPLEDCWTAETTTADKVLGIKWRSHHTIMKDLIDQQIRLEGKQSPDSLSEHPWAVVIFKWNPKPSTERV